MKQSHDKTNPWSEMPTANFEIHMRKCYAWSSMMSPSFKG